LTAAFYLARRGCRVTLYEEKSMLGGNLATRELQRKDKLLPKGVIDVYPHMYQDWYHNFWQLMKDAGVNKKLSFASFNSVHQMRPRTSDVEPKLSTLTYPYSPRYLLKNLASGMARPTDMFLFGCASIDLLAELGDHTVRLRNMSLTGFLNTRQYMTRAAIDAFETYIMGVWAIPAYQISALDCRTYAGYCYADPEGEFSLTTGPAKTAFLSQIKQKLDDYHVRIVTETRLNRVNVDVSGCVDSIVLQKTKWSQRRFRWVGAEAARKVELEPGDQLVLALPPKRLSTLVRVGNLGKRIVDFVPPLAELRRVTSQRVPMLHLCFTKDGSEKLGGIPREPVGLYGSEYNLAFTDISQVWTDVPAYKDRTVLAVSCSEPDLLPGPSYNDGYPILKELKEYIDFDPGEYWEDPKSKDVDWDLSRYHTNLDSQLSINMTGSDRWRPRPWYKEIDNLFFAGDACKNDFGITTVEAAVATGLAAANKLIERCWLGRGIEIKMPATLPREIYVALRCALLPAAYAARGIAMVEGPPPGEGPLHTDGAPPGGSPSPTAGPSLGGGEPSSGGLPSSGGWQPSGSKPDQQESMLRYLLTPGMRARDAWPKAERDQSQAS
jgi:hypothetical protein